MYFKNDTNEKKHQSLYSETYNTIILHSLFNIRSHQRSTKEQSVILIETFFIENKPKFTLF